VTITQTSLVANGGAAQADDVVLCWVFSWFDNENDGYSQRLPSGFTLIDYDSYSTGYGFQFGWKLAGASEGDYTSTAGDKVISSQMSVVVVSGAAAPHRDASSFRAFSSSTPYFQSIEPLSDGVVILVGTIPGASNTYTEPTGTTSRSALASGGTFGFYTRIMSYDLTAPGPTGDFVPATYSMSFADTFFFAVAIQ
jgi:hypothetical protein